MINSKANNKLYVQFIMQNVSKKVRKTRALVAIYALQAAVKSTWQDSGQFAFNWQIAIGHGSRKGITPDFGRGMPPVGRRGENRSAAKREMVVYHGKMQEHGINSNNPQMTRLFSELSRTSGRMPQISIFNPLFDKGVSSGHQTPRPYWYYATKKHPEHHTEEAIRQAVDKAVAIAHQKTKEKAW